MQVSEVKERIARSLALSDHPSHLRVIVAGKEWVSVLPRATRNEEWVIRACVQDDNASIGKPVAGTVTVLVSS